MDLDYHVADRRSLLRRRLRLAAKLTGTAIALIATIFLALKIKTRLPILSAQAQCAAYEPATPVEVLRIRRKSPRPTFVGGRNSDGSEAIENSAAQPRCLLDFLSLCFLWKAEYLIDIGVASPDSDGFATCFLHELTSPSNAPILIRIGVGPTSANPPFRIWAATPANLFSDPKPLTVNFSIVGHEFSNKPWISYYQQLQIFSGHMDPGSHTTFRIPFIADGIPGTLRGELKNARDKNEDYYVNLTID